MSDSNVAQTGHPRGLYTLFFSEMWERFCYYGMRVLLTLYLVKSLMKGDSEAALIYGAYTALIYAAPVLGGRMADTYLGYRLAIIFGAICMAIGEFLIIAGAEEFLLFGMGFLIVGNGYFKANISTIVGKLYEDGDSRRDSGFTIFYIGINVGALLATTAVAFIGETYGFKWGFGLAGAGMLLGLLTFWFGRENYSAADGLEIKEAGLKSWGPVKVYQAVLILSFLLIPACYFLISQNQWLTYLLLALFAWVSYSLINVGFKESKVWGQRMIALCIFMVINVVFWACFEQAGTSLTLFADRNVSRTILGWTMPASMTQFFNPLFIIVFGSFFSVMWVRLTRIGRNPSIPMKFALGILQLGLGFLVTKVGFALQLDGFLVPLWTLIFLYLLHTTGELFLSPIGLSMVTKLSPKHAAGTAMGGWFLSFAIANFLGGQIATLTGAEGHGAKADPALSVTVKQGLSENGNAADFGDWQPLITDGAVNITYGQFIEQKAFVEFREDISQGVNYSEWKSALGDHWHVGSIRFSDDTAHSSTESIAWLEPVEWNGLKDRLRQLSSADSTALASNSSADVLDFDSWKYFVNNLADHEFDEGMELSEAYSKHRDTVQEESLEKYVGVFGVIGYVLLAFALLIALLNKPLKSLMHGVE